MSVERETERDDRDGDENMEGNGKQRGGNGDEADMGLVEPRA